MTTTLMRINQIKQWIEDIADQQDRLDNEAAILRKTLDSLEAVYRVETNARGQEGPTNRELITAIFERDGGPLTKAHITESLFNEGLIVSSNGKSGVNNIVSTAIDRGLNKKFIKVGYGLYDLLSRVFPTNGQEPEVRQGEIPIN